MSSPENHAIGAKAFVEMYIEELGIKRKVFVSSLLKLTPGILLVIKHLQIQGNVWKFLQKHCSIQKIYLCTLVQ